MTAFFSYASFIVKSEYIIGIIIYIVYFANKWNKTKIVCSPFNFQVLFFLFTLFAISPFQYNYLLANTWSFFPTSDYLLRLNECYAINLFGFNLMGFLMILFERRTNLNPRFAKMISGVYYNTNDRFAKYTAPILVGTFIFYVIIMAQGVPLFNGNRLFAQESNQAVFLLMQATVYIMAWYFIGSLARNRVEVISWVIVLTFVMALAFTANRTPPLKIAYAALIIFTTTRKKINYTFIFKQLKYAIFIFLAGVVLIILRGGLDFISVRQVLLQQVVFGSTFSDMRDGARVFWGFHNNYDTFLFGKNYLAAILSFVPSSLADSNIPFLSAIASLRMEYTAGRWSTYTLFGINNHYGLRSGMFSGAYFNFGFVGVVIAAIVLAYWFSNCEILFIKMIKEKEKVDFKKLLFSYCFVSTLFELIYAPSGFNSFWGYLLILILMVIFKGSIVISRRSLL